MGHALRKIYNFQSDNTIGKACISSLIDRTLASHTKKAGHFVAVIYECANHLQRGIITKKTDLRFKLTRRSALLEKVVRFTCQGTM
jgi:hypothetical protein